MSWFEAMEHHDYEELVLCQDRASGLKAIIAIHDTTLGPALGGTRMWTYASEEAAIEDALRLARGMTYKHAVSGLNLGGGKAVIIGDPRRDKNEAMFRAFGRYIQGLNGRYVTAEDVGTTEEDMNLIYQETDYVTGISPSYGSSGNPSPATAWGVYRGMKAAAKQHSARICWKAKPWLYRAWAMWRCVFANICTKKARILSLPISIRIP